MSSGNLIENLNFAWSLEFSIFLIAVLILSVSCLAISLNFRQQNKKLRQSLTQIQNELRAINNGHLGMGREIRKVSREVAEQDSIHDDLDNEKGPKTYEQAGLLLSHGATIDEVVDSFDIAPAEAELLATMHQLSLKDDFQEDEQYVNIA